MKIKRLFKRAKKCKRKQGYEIERDLIESQANKLMSELTTIMLEAEEKMPGHNNTTKPSRRKKDGWSPKFIKKAREMRKVISILRRVKATNNNKRRERLVNEIYKTYGGNRFEPWDGTKDGDQLPVGTYYYVINLAGQDEPITGPVTIIR